jgi:hypothetical protein
MQICIWKKVSNGGYVKKDFLPTIMVENKEKYHPKTLANIKVISI